MLIRTRFWRRKIHTYCVKTFVNPTGLTRVLSRLCTFFLPTKFFDLKLSIVTREFRCGGAQKAYSLLSDDKLKITVNMPFQAGPDEHVMVNLPRRKNTAGDVL